MSKKVGRPLEGGSKSTDGYQARKAWEKHWGKKIPKGYIVAHKNDDPTDNSLDNLRIMTLAQHNKLTKKGKTHAEQVKGVKNKPNIGTEDGVQKRFRK